jgi:hypothetical protein
MIFMALFSAALTMPLARLTLARTGELRPIAETMILRRHRP